MYIFLEKKKKKEGRAVRRGRLRVGHLLDFPGQTPSQVIHDRVLQCPQPDDSPQQRLSSVLLQGGFCDSCELSGEVGRAERGISAPSSESLRSLRDSVVIISVRRPPWPRHDCLRGPSSPVIFALSNNSIDLGTL